MAAQNQSIRTNLVKAKIDKSQGDSLCIVCRKVDESIDDIVSGCLNSSRCFNMCRFSVENRH